MRLTFAALLVAFIALLVVLPATATTGKGQLFHDGAVVGTVVTPSPIAAGSGTDPFYNVTNGASGQLGIAGVQSRIPMDSAEGHAGHPTGAAQCRGHVGAGLDPFLGKPRLRRRNGDRRDALDPNRNWQAFRAVLPLP